MPDPIASAGAILGGKKVMLGMIGMMATTSDDIVKIWPLVAVLIIPLATGAFFMGNVSQKLTQIADNGKVAHDNIHDHFNSELAARDIKIDLSYARATQGKRYTSDMGAAAEERIRRLEAKANEPSRYEADGKELELRVDTIESRIYECELQQRLKGNGT